MMTADERGDGKLLSPEPARQARCLRGRCGDLRTQGTYMFRLRRSVCRSILTGMLTRTRAVVQFRGQGEDHERAA